MQGFKTSQASRNRAAKILALIGDDTVQVSIKRDRGTPAQEAQGMAEEFGIAGSLKAAWTMFREATTEESRNRWKRIGDALDRMQMGY